jgi:hypothetical protein
MHRADLILQSARTCNMPLFHLIRIDVVLVVCRRDRRDTDVAHLCARFCFEYRAEMMRVYRCIRETAGVRAGNIVQMWEKQVYIGCPLAEACQPISLDRCAAPAMEEPERPGFGALSETSTSELSRTVICPINGVSV